MYRGWVWIHQQGSQKPAHHSTVSGTHYKSNRKSRLFIVTCNSIKKNVDKY